MKPGLTLSKRSKLRRQQARADERDESERHLRNNENAAKPIAAARGGGAAAFFEDGVNILADRLDSGDESADDAGVEKQIAIVKARTQALRLVSFTTSRSAGGELAERAEACRGEKHSTDAAENGKEDAFGEQLRDEAATACAERNAQRDFFLTSGVTREKQIDNVSAGDEKDETYRREKDEQRDAQLGSGRVLHFCAATPQFCGCRESELFELMVERPEFCVSFVSVTPASGARARCTGGERDR